MKCYVQKKVFLVLSEGNLIFKKYIMLPTSIDKIKIKTKIIHISILLVISSGPNIGIWNITSI